MSVSTSYSLQEIRPALIKNKKNLTNCLNGFGVKTRLFRRPYILSCKNTTPSASNIPESQNKFLDLKRKKKTLHL